MGDMADWVNENGQLAEIMGDEYDDRELDAWEIEAYIPDCDVFFDKSEKIFNVVIEKNSFYYHWRMSQDLKINEYLGCKQSHHHYGGEFIDHHILPDNIHAAIKRKVNSLEVTDKIADDHA